MKTTKLGAEYYSVRLSGDLLKAIKTMTMQIGFKNDGATIKYLLQLQLIDKLSEGHLAREGKNIFKNNPKTLEYLQERYSEIALQADNCQDQARLLLKHKTILEKNFSTMLEEITNSAKEKTKK